MDTLEQNNPAPKSEAKPSTGKRVLRARPVEGPIDHKALSRKHMARFPKIIAALAESERRCGNK